MGVNANDAASAAAAVTSEGGVKYRLVEAEEVDAAKAQQQQQQQTAAAAPASAPRSAKAKGKVNWTQFPLADNDATQSSKTDSENGEFRQRNNRGRGRGGRFGHGGRGGGRGAPPSRRPQYDDHGVYYNGVYVPNTDPKMTAQWAKSQIEFYFSPDNLVRDIFLRQHMDVDGYVPLAFVGSFQAVYSLHQDYASLLEAMKDSEVLELDLANEKIRLRENWATWVWPNAEGGFGVPRYVKLQEEDAGNAQ